MLLINSVFTCYLHTDLQLSAQHVINTDESMSQFEFWISESDCFYFYS